MTNEKATDHQQSRANIIQTVQTPLGFFALVVLVVEVIFGITANFGQGSDRTYLVVGMIGLMFLLVGIVIFLAYIRPEALQGKSSAVTKITRDVVAPVLKVDKPSILCASTLFFEELGFKLDTEIIQKSFHRRVTVEHNISSERLRELLTDREFHIIHLLGNVNPADGSFIFENKDYMSADGFSKLLEVCKARLVILATCDSVALAAKVSRTTNMIAATTTMEIKDFLQWEQCFYRMLSRGDSVSSAYGVANATTNTPMVLLMKQDIKFA